MDDKKVENTQVEENLISQLLETIEEEKSVRNDVFENLTHLVKSSLNTGENAVQQKLIEKLESENSLLNQKIIELEENKKNNRVGLHLDTTDLNNKLVNFINERLLEELEDKERYVIENKELENKLFKSKVKFNEVELEIKEIEIEKARLESKRSELESKLERIESKYSAIVGQYEEQRGEMEKIYRTLEKSTNQIDILSNQKSIIDEKLKRAVLLLEEKEQFIQLVKVENEKNMDLINSQKQEIYELEIANKKMELEIKKLKIKETF